jgi:hypothetical protein
MAFLSRKYRVAVQWAIEHRRVTVGAGAAAFALAVFLMASGLIGSEFLPHLDEGAIWVRGTLAPSTGPTEGVRVADEARVILASFPEVTVVTSQVGRPDDGTDVTGFFNTEYFVDLKPKNKWRPVFRQDKDALIAAMDRELSKMPGVLWNFSQPISDNMEEAVSGVKGELAIKLYGDDLQVLEDKGDEIVNVMRGVPGVEDLGLFRVLGQPNLNISVDRQQAARYGINIADVQDAVETAVGGKAVSQVLQGEQRYDLVVRYQAPYRDTKEAIENIRLLAPSGERVSLAQLAKVSVRDGASSIAREENSRYIAIKYSVRGRDLGSTVEEAMKRVKERVKLGDRGAHHPAGDFHYPVHDVRLGEVGGLDSRECRHRAHRRFTGAADYRHAPQRVVGHRIPCAFRCVGRDRRHHAGIYQPVARARTFHRGLRDRRRRAAPAADHDDHARRDPGPVTRGAFPGHWLRLAAAFRDCHCRRTNFGADYGHLPVAGHVRVDCARRRQAARGRRILRGVEAFDI